MKILRVFEAFAGYGSQRMALRNLGIEHEVVAISEIDKYAIASYEAIHGETNNLGDISKIQVADIPNHDLFTYSFPCQDISIAGNLEGFSKDSGTRSGLLWECQRVIDAKKPKYLLMENVRNLISKKFMPGFQEWIDYLESIGYSNYWEVLNAKDFGIPQNRERVFMVSILGEHEPYVFPKPIKLEKRLKDVLEDEVDEKYYLSKKIQDRLTIKLNMDNEIKTIGSTKGKDNTRLGQRDIVYSSKGIMGALNASDYKQPKQIGEPEIKQVAQYDTPTRKNSSRFRTYDTSGVAPTLNTMQGGGLEPHIPEPTVNKVDITQKVIVRKHKVDTRKLVQTLRSHKNATNREIAEKLGLPITQVEHWFRTDDSFSIPNSDIWYELKEMLEIKTDEFDKPITEFIEEDGVYEKAERHYFTDGIAPTLTSTSAAEKIIEGVPIKNATEPSFVIGSTQKNASVTDGSYSPTLTSSMGTGGGHVPMIPIKNATEQGYLLTKDGDGVDLAYPTSNTRRGRVQKSMSQTLTTDDSKGVVELIPKEKFGRMGEQAVRTQNELRLPHGETLNPWNEKQSSANGVAPTLTTRPEGFKTAISVTDHYRIRKLTPLECWRLMDVTDEDFYKAQAVNSNTQLYKQAGNSIVVSVLEAIFRNMFLEVPEEDLVGEHIPLF